jgi:hypothetical protein
MRTLLILGFSPHPPLVVDSTSHSCNSLSSLELTLVIGFNESFWMSFFFSSIYTISLTHSTYVCGRPCIGFPYWDVAAGIR